MGYQLGLGPFGGIKDLRISFYTTMTSAFKSLTSCPQKSPSNFFFPGSHLRDCISFISPLLLALAALPLSEEQKGRMVSLEHLPIVIRTCSPRTKIRDTSERRNFLPAFHTTSLQEVAKLFFFNCSACCLIWL